MILATICKK